MEEQKTTELVDVVKEEGEIISGFIKETTVKYVDITERIDRRKNLLETRAMIDAEIAEINASLE